jgi:hypothetical protein
MSSTVFIKRLLRAAANNASKQLTEYKPDLRKSIGAVDDKRIYANAITTPKIADNAITTIKLVDDSVTIPKLSFDPTPHYAPAWYEELALTVGNGKGPLRRIAIAMTLVSCYIYVKTAPTGAAILIDIKKSTTPNGTFTSIFSSVPTIAIGAYLGSSTSFASPTLAVGDFLRFDITQVGSSVPGDGLTVDLNTTGIL